MSKQQVEIVWEGTRGMKHLAWRSEAEGQRWTVTAGGDTAEVPPEVGAALAHAEGMNVKSVRISHS